MLSKLSYTMKKLYILTALLLTAGLLFGQKVTLTYSGHGLAADQTNNMKLAGYVEPGPAGANQVWDLSGMETGDDFQGFVAASFEADSENSFPEANVVLNEQGNQFFFSLEEDRLLARGTMTKSGRVLMKYHRPYVKMLYPFAYGDEVSGDYSGTYFLTDKEVPLEGTYRVAADGNGRLILPGGKVVENTLRVVSERSYDILFENNTMHYENLTYRWYGQDERFPLAVIIRTRSTACGNGNDHFKAAYRVTGQQEKATGIEVLSAEAPKVFPNPVHDRLTVEFRVAESNKVLMEMYDNTGRKVAVLIDRHMDAGSYSETFSTNRYSMEPGAYYIRSLMGETLSTTPFILER